MNMVHAYGKPPHILGELLQLLDKAGTEIFCDEFMVEEAFRLLSC